MNISRFIWFWQRRAYERAGWAVDGGIWPCTRVVRPFYGIDRAPNEWWHTRSAERGIIQDQTKGQGKP